MQLRLAIEKIVGGSLIVDTNFFIDASYDEDIFGSIVNELRSNKIKLLTIAPVVLEFCRGTKTQNDLAKKQDLVKSIIDEAALSIDNSIDQAVIEQTIPAYRSRGLQTSVVDLYLAATLMRFSNEPFFVLSSDLRAFPPDLFKLEGLFPIETQDVNRIYGIFQCITDKPSKMDKV